MTLVWSEWKAIAASRRESDYIQSGDTSLSELQLIQTTVVFFNRRWRNRNKAFVSVYPSTFNFIQLVTCMLRKEPLGFLSKVPDANCVTPSHSLIDSFFRYNLSLLLKRTKTNDPHSCHVSHSSADKKGFRWVLAFC